MKDELIYIHNEIGQIFVRGIDAIHIANALQMLDELIRKDEEDNGDNNQ